VSFSALHLHHAKNPAFLVNKLLNYHFTDCQMCIDVVEFFAI